MSGIEALLGLAGHWRGRNRLWMSPDAPVSESATSASLLSSLRAKFLRIDYTWVEPGGEPQEGAMIIAYDPTKDAAEVHWADSWHIGQRVMVLVGTLGSDGDLAVRGSYPAPEGPDWGWTIEIRPDGPRELRMTMHNVPPGSQPLLAVEAVYTRGE